MRINVYSQELANDVNMLEKESNTGLVYSARAAITSPRLTEPRAA